MERNEQLDDAARWRIALAKDRRFDGVFVTGVHSTGIYCRPSCPARAPRRENVRFYSSPAQAEAAGLRACKRCAPDQQSREEAAVRAAIDLLRHSEAPVPLARLGAATDYSPAHFQRLFTRSTGLSPAAYQRALKKARADEALTSAGSVTEAIYMAGYGAPSRFYDARKGSGMAAATWRKGGAGQVLHWAVVETSVAPMLVAATDTGVCLLAFNEGEADLRRRFPHARLEPAGEPFRALFARAAAAVERPGTGADIPLDVRGTAFQQRVWQALRAIPPGETRSYGELAALLGNPKASRAVGGANGANQVAVLIPCHRVIAADGRLGGYAYGSEIKAELLKREGR
ncbi:MAG: bifunctional transcriptional activator/DNA repair enzyme AdaA [Sphingomonadaceae bacterium]